MFLNLEEIKEKARKPRRAWLSDAKGFEEYYYRYWIGEARGWETLSVANDLSGGV